jgi:hypothetical protein
MSDASMTVDQSLDEFERSVMPADGQGAMKYVGLPQEELHMMSAEECGEAAVMLTCLSFHLAKQANKLRAKIRYCNETILKSVAGKTGNYRYQSPDERMSLAIQEDDHATSMKKHEVTLSCRLERIDYLSLRLEKIADMFSSLAATKRRQS